MPARRYLIAMPAALAVAATQPARATAGACGDPALAALLERYVALKNAHDASRCAELYAQDYQEHSGRSPHGLPALVATWQAQFEAMPDLRLRLDDSIMAGDRIVARMTYAATHTRPLLGQPPTGRAFTFGTIDIWRVAGGKFIEHWDQVDFAGLARQLSAR